MSNKLEGKVAIITGGSKGIGRAIALELSKNGVHTALFSRSEAPLQKAVAEIKALPESRKYNLNPTYVTADVGNVEEVKRAVSIVHNTYGHIDILVNNAGTYVLDRLTNLSSEKLAQMCDTNLKGVIIVTREILPIFEEQGSGTILDIGSTAALEILDQNNAYGPTKHAHRVFSNIVDMEHKNVNVYRIHPSNTETAGRANSRSELEKEIRGNSKFLAPSEIGKQAIKLITNQYTPDINEIRVYANQETGQTKVDRIKAKLVVKFEPIE
jgi:3-oxoacyl-[acyl-carrier protein] reductase